ncbi:hypothetical protein CHS0354_030087 [Potamilus streckersoni]|uniref:Uncharacterized protein n=1 Tax=Potamilus streckersoni TaxID=2493646 RepID=A0AAE0RMB4_9BIVA|nr:hypothetical protein CHS0354_030087 [Potamilus streckersoni]
MPPVYPYALLPADSCPADKIPLTAEHQSRRGEHINFRKLYSITHEGTLTGSTDLQSCFEYSEAKIIASAPFEEYSSLLRPLTLAGAASPRKRMTRMPDSKNRSSINRNAPFAVITIQTSGRFFHK